MSAGISYMYRKSGGCDWKHRCMDCKYMAISESRSFGKKDEVYRCTKHPGKESSDRWKPGYTACRYWKETKNQTAYLEAEDGQLSFLFEF